MSFKIRHLALAIATFSPLMANAAGLDRSTQPSWGFTQDGTFAYVEHITIDPKVGGKDMAQNKVKDIAEEYHFLNFGAKADINDRVSVGAFFDQPWGADVQYSGNNNFVSQDANATINKLTEGKYTTFAAARTAYATATAQVPALTAVVNSTTATATQKAQAAAGLQQIQGLGQAIGLAGINHSQAGEGTSVNVSSQNFTGLVGLKFGDKNQFQVYGGPALQKLEADIHLRGTAYRGATGYDANVSSSTGYGWVAGLAYSKPEIALKAAVTYRSEIDHDTAIGESFPALGLTATPVTAPVQTNKTTITTPKSVNVDFQTGVNPTTLLTAKVRWVPWNDFAVTPKVYNKASKVNLVDYDKDGWTAELGIGKKLSDKWAVSGSVGWDSGAGNPATTLGPIEGNWNVGLGAKYNITPEWSVSAGAKYLMLGDATAQLPDHATNVGEFKDNDGMVYGVRLAYQKK